MKGREICVDTHILENTQLGENVMWIKHTHTHTHTHKDFELKLKL